MLSSSERLDPRERVVRVLHRIADWESAPAGEGSSDSAASALSDATTVSTSFHHRQANKQRRYISPTDADLLQSSIYAQVMSRDTVESFFKRLVELLAINFAVNSSRVFDRTSDVFFVFLVFLCLTILNFAVKYKLEEWNRRVIRQKSLFDVTSRPILEQSASNQLHLPTTTPTTPTEEDLCAKALLDARVIDGDTVNVSFAEMLYTFMDYVLYIADVFVAFVFVRLIISRVEGSYSVPSTRVIERMAKPLIAVAILYAAIILSSYRQRKLLEQ